MVSQTNPNVGVYAQDEWKVSPRLTLNVGLRYDLQFLETINTDTNNVSPRVGLRLVAVRVAAHRRARQRRAVLRSRAAARAGQRAPVGRQHDRPGQPAADQREPVADAGRRAGVSEHPERRRAVGHAAQPDDDGSEHAERLFHGRRASRSSSSSASAARSASATSTCAAMNLIISVNQNVPSCVAAGTNNGCRPNPNYANNSQYSSAARLELSRPARVVRAAAGALGQLPRHLHAVEVDEQRRRVLLQLADRSVRSLEGLGPLRRRPAASARVQRRGQLVDGAGADGVGATQPRLPVEQHAAVLLGAAVQHHVRRQRPFRAPPAGRS